MGSTKMEKCQWKIRSSLVPSGSTEEKFFSLDGKIAQPGRNENQAKPSNHQAGLELEYGFCNGEL
jgi:hypothetical protein